MPGSQEQRPGTTTEAHFTQLREQGLLPEPG